ncbi:MAG: DUF2345 domain-containing protein [Oscillospiraceae bacterium]|nr:DUF2345 domain-containing protein [Oscillospiraceae bacterium]
MRIIIVKKSNKILPIEDINVKILQKLNEHATAYVTGVLTYDAYFEYLESTTSETEFVIDYIETADNSTQLTLFVGLCKKMRNISRDPIGKTEILVEIELISYSYLMDIKKVNRSFQDKEMLYGALLAVVNSDEGSSLYGNAAEGIKTGQFILQYNETNWDFAKRLASRLNEPLICDYSRNIPGYKFGFSNPVDRGEVESYDYSISRNISDFMVSSQNDYIQFVSEIDFTRFQIITEGSDPIIYNVGDSITYQGEALYISEVEAEMKNFSFSTLYKLNTRIGLKQNPLYNSEMRGISLLGKVIDVSENKLKLHLIDIDKSQSIDSAYWFRYATFYSTFYCMPEKGDIVNLHFPSRDESKAVAINSVKKDPESGLSRDSSMVSESNTGNDGSSSSQGSGRQPPVDFASMANNQQVKMLSNDSGKTVVLSDSSIIIQCNDGTFITLTDGIGIDIITADNITVNSVGKISLMSKDTIAIEATNKIEIKSDGSFIKLDPAVIEVRASDIKMNN